MDFAMERTRRDGEQPWLTGAALVAVVLAAAISAVAGGAEWGEWSRGDPRPLARLTCHFVHYGVAHAAWNALALLLTGLVAERVDRRALRLATLLALPLIPLAIAIFAPELHSYRGASGLASAWFTVALLGTWRSRRDRVGRALVALALVLFAAKLVGELAFDARWFVDDAAAGFASVPLAHAVGALAGALAWIVSSVPQRDADRRTRRSKTSVRSMRASSVSSTVQKSGSTTPSTTLRPSTVTTSGCFGS